MKRAIFLYARITLVVLCWPANVPASTIPDNSRTDGSLSTYGIEAETVFRQSGIYSVGGPDGEPGLRFHNTYDIAARPYTALEGVHRRDKTSETGNRYATHVSEPVTLLLIGSGMIGIAFLRRRFTGHERR